MWNLPCYLGSTVNFLYLSFLIHTMEIRVFLRFKSVETYALNTAHSDSDGFWSILFESYFTKDNYHHLKVKNGFVTGSRKMSNNGQTEDFKSSIYNYLYHMHWGSSKSSCGFDSSLSLRTKSWEIQRLVSRKAKMLIRAYVPRMCWHTLWFFVFPIFVVLRVFLYLIQTVNYLLHKDKIMWL